VISEPAAPRDIYIGHTGGCTVQLRGSCDWRVGACERGRRRKVRSVGAERPDRPEEQQKGSERERAAQPQLNHWRGCSSTARPPEYFTTSDETASLRLRIGDVVKCKNIRTVEKKKLSRNRNMGSG
jgi:hypothetical protein